MTRLSLLCSLALRTTSKLSMIICSLAWYPVQHSWINAVHCSQSNHFQKVNLACKTRPSPYNFRRFIRPQKRRMKSNAKKPIMTNTGRQTKSFSFTFAKSSHTSLSTIVISRRHRSHFNPDFVLHRYIADFSNRWNHSVQYYQLP